MNRDKSLGAFLGDPQWQARAVAAGRACRSGWLATPQATQLAGVLTRLADLDQPSLSAFDALVEPLCADHGWVQSLVERWVGLLTEDPFVDLPWLPLNSGAMSGLDVLSDGPASCALLTVDAARLAGADPGTLVFDSGYNRFALLAGGPLAIERYRRDAANGGITLVERATLLPGDSFCTDCAIEQMRMVGASCDAVLLRFSLQDLRARHGTIEAFDLSSGALVRTGCADPLVSRMLALLDVAGAADPESLLPVLETLSHHANPQLRWQAMRMWLARNLLTAEPRLRSMALDDASDDVRAAATAALRVVEPALRDWLAHSAMAA